MFSRCLINCNLKPTIEAMEEENTNTKKTYKITTKSKTVKTERRTISNDADGNPVEVTTTSKALATSAESLASKSSEPFDKTFVMFKSLVRVEGIKEIKAKADGNSMTITTDKKVVTIDKPGKYILNAESDFEPRDMTDEEVDKFKGGLDAKSLKKLESNK
ncbi:hypothetical protein HDE_03739 [Halotydeus destructor]|nr:hypothetical protein HDE_03739 [Halotydeus destructor]